MTKPIIVKSCAECPFFVQTAASFLIAFMPSIEAKAPFPGSCDCPEDSGVKHHPMGASGRQADLNRDRKDRRLRILDGNKLPDACPLRASDVLVTLGS